ncbi:WD40 repeat domain-containing protein [Streptomyces virginiae]|uniref:WD40 repeat domain-containing protein n=1 Tax=Streptomyces virginiae TaxID=1961 RepID=UPI00368CA28A
MRLWDAATGKLRATLPDATSGLWSVAFSPDGQTIAAAADDKTVWLWDVATRTARAPLTGHTDTVTSVAFSPDGHTLASGSGDTTVRLWNAVLPDPEAAIRKICQAVHRESKSNLLSSVNYAYDTAGNPTSITDTYPDTRSTATENSSPLVDRQCFTYDAIAAHPGVDRQQQRLPQQRHRSRPQRDRIKHPGRRLLAGILVRRDRQPHQAHRPRPGQR